MGTPGSKDSESSFLKDLEDTLREGEKDVERGKRLFTKAKKKRDRAKANEESERGGEA